MVMAAGQAMVAAVVVESAAQIDKMTVCHVVFGTMVQAVGISKEVRVTHLLT